MPTVLVTSLNGEEGPHFEILKEAGFETRVVNRDLDLWQPENLIAELQGVSASIAGSEPYTPEVLRAATDLRCICRTGVGFDAVDLPTCDELGIVVSTTPGVNHHSVAEHTIALLMGVARGFPETDRQVRESRWKRIARPRVMGNTLGIVGLGRIGRAVAWRARGLGMHVIAYEPFPNQEFVEQMQIELLPLEELFQRSDYISLHLPATAESIHMINDESLALMKPTAVLINTARGALIDEKALYKALSSGKLRGAALDVFEVEPLPADSPLLTLDNILFAGHLAGLDEESHQDTFSMAADTAIQLRDGNWPAERIQNLRGATGWTWER